MSSWSVVLREKCIFAHKLADMLDLEKLKYPIGHVHTPSSMNDIDITQATTVIQKLPDELMDITLGLNPKDLEHTYRPGGWNIKQVIHHLADSHMHAFSRFKYVVTEGDQVEVKAYKEALWAGTPEIDDSIDDSLLILRGVHNRWSKLIHSLDPQILNKGYYHSEMKRNVPLFEAVAQYEWHCKHHLAHIHLALKNME